ncbi:related to MCD4 - sporulation protein [Ustilago trichophora]|uniref:GPI ethanolamine phosphate transferase 1 n=1 Tax=Ustilago trichophora TaxID=86804 RepID=A0A5C3DV42_9BASI|nr:related to MCD4 - sporulation protein [Ustilago trichophora]
MSNAESKDAGSSVPASSSRRNNVNPAGSIQVKRLSKISSVRFLFLSLLFHVIYIGSIFDIYFTSPVVHPQPRFSVQGTLPTESNSAHLEAPAKRLVLIVGDGLRADTLYKKHTADVLPTWSATRDRSFASDGIMGSWSAFARDPLGQPYPYPLALQSDKSPDTRAQIAGQVPVAAFAAPFLRSVLLNRGAWGLSHTRVPTESRPGHVAMIAGMYEDVSAVTKGWKLNPIAFDSLLNQSSHSFAFGSPDIVPMFAQGAAADRVDMWTYNEEDEDFTKDASHLDLWVLDRLRELLDKAKNDKELSLKMREPGTVFFLHLLGLDTTGHTYRPLSPEYVGNTIVVDAIAREVEKLMDDFYQHDGRTAYFFTADHGMSLKGNHGDGDPHNTRTPLVAWGAGVRGPQPATAQQKRDARSEQIQDPYFADWHLDDISRADIDQADITPLMATILGVPVPANSEGRLRLDLVDLSEEHKARALVANAQQVLETYRVKHNSRARRMVRFKPFAPLSRDMDEKRPGEKRVAQIQTNIDEGRYDEAIAMTNTLMDHAIEGAHYLQTYDWLLLCSIVTVGYIGSMVYAFSFLLRNHMLPDDVVASLTPASNTKPQPSMLKFVLAPISGSVFALFAAQEMPISYYLYTALAFLFWGRVVDDLPLFAAAYHQMLQSNGGISMPNTVLAVFASLAMLELIAVGYLYRVAWFVGLILLGFAWPAFGLTADFKSDNEGLVLVWALSCLMTGLFTIGDVNKEESILLLMLSAVAFLAAGYFVLKRPHLFFPRSADPTQTFKDSEKGDSTKDAHNRRVQDAHSVHLKHTLRTLRVQLVVLVVTSITTAISARSLRLKQGLPFVTQVLAWICLTICFIFPFAYGFRRAVSIKAGADGKTRTVVRQPSSQRLAMVVFAFAPVFVLLSLRDEVLFFGCYTVTLLVWAKLEGSLHEQKSEERETNRLVQLPELRVSLFYLFFLHIGFFGTGNIASISSFYLSPVYRLVPIFNPFLMATLLLVKILVPFLILNAVFSLLATTPPLSSKATLAKNIDRGLKLMGDTAPGGLGLESGLSLVFGAGIAADVLALNFLFAVKSEGSWLEIGQTITHFVMANLLQIFMLALAAASSVVLGQA